MSLLKIRGWLHRLKVCRCHDWNHYGRLTEALFIRPIGETSVLEHASSLVGIVIDGPENGFARLPLRFERQDAFAEEPLKMEEG